MRLYFGFNCWVILQIFPFAFDENRANSVTNSEVLLEVGDCDVGEGVDVEAQHEDDGDKREHFTRHQLSPRSHPAPEDEHRDYHSTAVEQVDTDDSHNIDFGNLLELLVPDSSY